MATAFSAWKRTCLIILAMGASCLVTFAADSEPESSRMSGEHSHPQSRNVEQNDVVSVEIIHDSADTSSGTVKLLLPSQIVGRILEDGLFSLGAEYGQVQMAGKPTPEIETEITAAIKQKLPEVELNVRVSVLGRSTTDAPIDATYFYSRGQLAPRGIAPGDILQIESQVDGLGIRRSVVESDGSLALGPRWGRINVSEMTLLEAETAIREHVEAHIEDPELQVTFVGHSVDGSAPTSSVMADPSVVLKRFEREISDVKALLLQYKSLIPR